MFLSIINFILATTSDKFDKSANIANVFFYIFLVLSLVCFAFAIFCFIKFNIVKIINDLSGRTARKSVAKKRMENEKSGDKSFKPTAKAKERGTKTDKIRDSEKLFSKKEKASAKISDATDVLEDGTDVLAPENSVGNKVNDAQGTDVLSDATELLVNNMAPETEVLPSRLKVLQSVVLIHTEEVIK